MRLNRLEEAGLVKALRSDFGDAGRGVEIGIGDDAAVVRFGRQRLLLTKDLLAEDVDFRRAWQPPFFLGRKSLNVNLSDVAAMGGRPLYALLGLALPERLETRWVEEFLRGFRSAAEEHGLSLIGGDLSSASKIVISVTVIGRAAQPVRRSGARPGESLFVSGTLGDAAGGLGILKHGSRRPGGRDRASARLRDAFLDPMPRIALGRELAERRLVSAMIDLSDGLSVDLGHICRESHVGAEIWADGIPLSPELRKTFASPLKLALHGGEDYELLFSVPRLKLKDLLRLGRRYPLYPIGRITRGPKITLLGPGGRSSPLPARGWRHFRRR